MTVIKSFTDWYKKVIYQGMNRDRWHRDNSYDAPFLKSLKAALLMSVTAMILIALVIGLIFLIITLLGGIGFLFCFILFFFVCMSFVILKA